MRNTSPEFEGFVVAFGARRRLLVSSAIYKAPKCLPGQTFPLAAPGGVWKWMAGVRSLLRSTLSSPEGNLYFLPTFHFGATSACAVDGQWGLTPGHSPKQL